MAKESYWFKHDYNARSDRKMMSLLMKSGVEGIGIYWCVVEMLYEEGGFLLRSECDRIAFELRTDYQKVAVVIESDLFQRNEEKFWSESVLRRLSERQDKSEKNKNNALKRWEEERKKKEEEEQKRLAQSENDATAMRPHTDRNATVLPPQCEPDANGMLIREEEKREDSFFLNNRSISNEVSIKEEVLELKIEERAVKQKKEVAPVLRFPFTDEAFLSQWQEWKDFKAKDCKFHFKSTQSEQKALDQLAAISGGVEATAIEIINTSIANGWKGLFPLKNTVKNGTSYNFTSTSTNQQQPRSRMEALKDW